jgi:hypothetical protein
LRITAYSDMWKLARCGESTTRSRALTATSLADPCVLIRVETAPRAGAWVLPGSSKGSIGTFVPRNTLPGLKKDGRFQFLPRWVSACDLAGCPSLGCLPEPYRTRVLENANTVAVDFEVEL